MSKTPRIHSLDALRAIAMILGVFLHATIAYKAYPQPVWPHDPDYQSIGYDYLYFFIHSFRMESFYLIAGFFARLLWLRIGTDKFIIHRIKRVLIPFVACVLILVPITITPFIYYREFSSTQINSWSLFISSMRTSFTSWNGMAHLWFLYYLMMMYTVMMLFLNFRNNQKVIEIKAFIDRWFVSTIKNPRSIWIIIMINFGILLTFETLLVDAYTGLFPQWNRLLYYGLFFGYGWLLHKQVDYLDLYKTRVKLNLTVGFVLSLMVFYLSTNGQYTLPDILLKLLISAQTWTLVIGFLGLFLLAFSNENKPLRFISDSSYWLYLIHMPIVAWMQILLIGSSVPVEFRFLLINTVTIAIALVTYRYLVRYTFIGRVLHGKRNKPYMSPSKVTV